MKNTLNILLALLIFAASAVGLWLVGKWLFTQFHQFDWTAIPLTHGLGLMAIVLGMSWIANNINKVAKSLIKKEQFSTKLNLYKYCYSVLKGNPQTQNADTQMADLYQDLLLIAAPKVIQVFQNWQNAITANEAQSETISLYEDRLLLVMRKDLGLSNKGLLLGNLDINIPEQTVSTFAEEANASMI